MNTSPPKDQLIRYASAACAFVAAFSAAGALACSTVALGVSGDPLVAYSYDISGPGDGFVVVNPAGVHRTSIMEPNPAQWTSRHGSVTFNQLGPGMPTAGMNTDGLVVTLMWNDSVTYPSIGQGAVVNELEFIQRILDLAGSVDEALALLDDTVIKGLVPLHFFLADRGGDAAALTPTADGFLIHSDGALPVPALTNANYERLLSQLSAFSPFGGERTLPRPDATRGPSSLERFVLSADASRQFEAAVSSDEAFGVLNAVKNPQTRWQIVFDPVEGAIDYRLADGQRVDRIDLSMIVFACQTAPFALRLDPDDRPSSPLQFQTLAAEDLTAVLRSVLSGFQATIGLSPEIAPGLAAAQLGLPRCDG